MPRAKTYKPRRASLKRWLQHAPEWVLDVLDDRKSHDRYTVLLTGSQLVGDGTYAGTRIQFVAAGLFGSTYWGELSAHETTGYRYRCGKQRIRWIDLPDVVKKAVIARVEAPD